MFAGVRDNWSARWLGFVLSSYVGENETRESINRAVSREITVARRCYFKATLM